MFQAAELTSHNLFKDQADRLQPTSSFLILATILFKIKILRENHKKRWEGWRAFPQCHVHYRVVIFLPMPQVRGYTTSFSSCQPKPFKKSLHSDFDISPVWVIKALQPRTDITSLILSNVWIAESWPWKPKTWGVPNRACQYIRFSNLLSIWQSKH